MRSCLEAEDLAPGCCVPGQTTLLQNVQALVQHQQLRLPGQRGGDQDAVHREGVDTLWWYCALQMQQCILQGITVMRHACTIHMSAPRVSRYSPEWVPL